MNKKHFFKTNRAGFVSGAVLLVALTIGVGKADGQNVVITLPPPVVAPAVIQDDYVYYPNYEVYYNSRRHQYAHLENGAWVWAPAPNGVAVDVLLASPSVHMDFHDSLEKHHAEMLKQYPRNWRPAGAHPEAKDDRKMSPPDDIKK